MKTAFKVVAIAAVFSVTASGCQTLTGRTAGEIFDNKTTVGTVKTKLVRDRMQNLTWVNVDANDGVVYLTGNVNTAAQKQRATELAAETPGVTRVVNDIVVNEAGRTASAPAASPATTTASTRVASGTISGQVVTVDHGTGNVTLRSNGSDLQLRLPPASVVNVRPGDRLSVSVNAGAR
ncbi:MAG TPA: BON domain-containing protein [Methylomirabilota bacterium]|jgi:hypothetical protein